MRLQLSPELEAFREEMRTFFTTQVPQEIRDTVAAHRHVSKEQYVETQRLLNAAGLAVPHWPVEWGGRDWTPLQLHIWREEMQLAAVPEPLAFNTSMIGPVLATFGNQAQKNMFEAQKNMFEMARRQQEWQQKQMEAQLKKAPFNGPFGDNDPARSGFENSARVNRRLLKERFGRVITRHLEHAATPIRRSESVVASPPIPAPTTATFTVRRASASAPATPRPFRRW